MAMTIKAIGQALKSALNDSLLASYPQMQIFAPDEIPSSLNAGITLLILPGDPPFADYHKDLTGDIWEIHYRISLLIPQTDLATSLSILAPFWDLIPVALDANRTLSGACSDSHLDQNKDGIGKMEWGGTLYSATEFTFRVID